LTTIDGFHFSCPIKSKIYHACCSRNYPINPSTNGWYFGLNPPPPPPHPSGNASLASYFPVKILAFETPHSPRKKKRMLGFYLANGEGDLLKKYIPIAMEVVWER